MSDSACRLYGENPVPLLCTAKPRRRRRDLPMRADPLAAAGKRRSGRALLNTLCGIGAASLIRRSLSAATIGEEKEW